MNTMSQAAPGLARRSAVLVGRAMAAGGRALVQAIVPPMCLACRAPLGHHRCLVRGMLARASVSFGRRCATGSACPCPIGTASGMVSAAAVANPPVYGRARAVAAFDGVMRELIHGFKYADRHDARRLFGPGS